MVPDYPIAYDAGKALNSAAKAAGEAGYGAQWAGQAARLARTMPAAALVAQLRYDMEQASGIAPRQWHEKSPRAGFLNPGPGRGV